MLGRRFAAGRELPRAWEHLQRHNSLRLIRIHSSPDAAVAEPATIAVAASNLANVIGNYRASAVIARWESELTTSIPRDPEASQASATAGSGSAYPAHQEFVCSAEYNK